MKGKSWFDWCQWQENHNPAYYLRLKNANTGYSFLNGVDITNTSAQERVKMGISVTEGRRVFPGLTVMENLIWEPIFERISMKSPRT